MLNAIWVILVLASILVGAWTGRMDAVARQSAEAAKSAVTLALGLVGVMAFWLGMMQIAREAGLLQSLARGIRPLMTRLFPDVPADHPAMSAMIMNISSNMLGLANAATPFGIKAMMELERLNLRRGVATNGMALFLAINTSGVSILPTGVIAIRTAMGSAQPSAILFTTLFATICSTTVAIFACVWLSRLPRYSLSLHPIDKTQDEVDIPISKPAETASPKAETASSETTSAAPSEADTASSEADTASSEADTASSEADTASSEADTASSEADTASSESARTETAHQELKALEAEVAASGTLTQSSLWMRAMQWGFWLALLGAAVGHVLGEAMEATLWILAHALQSASGWGLWGDLDISWFGLSKDLLSFWMLPILIALLVWYGISRGIKVYDCLVQGAKEGFDAAIRIIPFLVAILVAIGMFRASGALDLLVGVLRPITVWIGMPAEALPMALLRPLSGSGAFGVMAETMNAHGPDSLIGMMVATFQGSTETTFYVLAVYFGAVQIKQVRHTLIACLMADVAGIMAAVWICRMMFLP
ncbi:spore maturation protein [Myxococcota bacterium]|nr:spore maturation protein [Myxococcota bacterium]